MNNDKKKYTLGNISEFYTPAEFTALKLSMYLNPGKAGFTSPAEDYSDEKLNLEELLIEHPLQSFYVRISGDSMKDFGIMDTSIVLVDRYPTEQPGDIVLASVNYEFNVKQYDMINGNKYLIPGNSKYEKVQITDGMEFEVRGVITATITKLNRKLLRLWGH